MEQNKESIKHVLLAVAQSRSLHVVHEAYLCESWFSETVQLEDDQDDDEE